jgi:hypothetical protein
MQTQSSPGYGSLVLFWLYGVVCGLGIASTTVGLLRGESLPGVIWPALIPLLVGPLLILRVIGRKSSEPA